VGKTDSIIAQDVGRTVTNPQGESLRYSRMTPVGDATRVTSASQHPGEDLARFDAARQN